MRFAAFSTLMLSIKPGTVSGSGENHGHHLRAKARTDEQEEYGFWSFKALSELNSMVVSFPTEEPSSSPIEEPSSPPTTSYPSLGDTSRSPRSEDPTPSPTTSSPSGEPTPSPTTSSPSGEPIPKTSSSPSVGETSPPPSLVETSRSPRSEEPSPSPSSSPSSSPSVGATSPPPSLVDTSRAPRSEEPTPSPSSSPSSEPSLGDTSRPPASPEPTQSSTSSFYPSLGDTFLDPISEEPTTSKDVIFIENAGIMYNDILNIVSYSTYCVPGEYTSVQIITLLDNRVYCITNSQGTGVELGYEEDFPDRPVIKLNVEPPTQSDCDEKVVGPEVPHYCGFPGKPSFKIMSRDVDTFDNDDVVDIPIPEVASFTKYCDFEDSVNVEVVNFDGSVECYINSPEASEMNFFDPSTDEVVAMIDLEASGCDELDGEIKSSVPCSFDGVRTTEYPNFDLDNSGNITSRMLGSIY